MNMLLTGYNALFDRIEAQLAPIVLPLAARLVFAGTLVVYFWNSALTKLTGPLTLDFGAYAQILPKRFEAAGYDPSQFGIIDRAVILLGTYAEFILPAMIVIGLLTRLAAIGMIGFILVQSLTDIFGHGADATTVGAWFDRASDSHIMDQRAFWVFLLLFLALRGAGALSVDRFLLGKPARNRTLSSQAVS